MVVLNEIVVIIVFFGFGFNWIPFLYVSSCDASVFVLFLLIFNNILRYLTGVFLSFFFSCDGYDVFIFEQFAFIFALHVTLFSSLSRV